MSDTSLTRRGATFYFRARVPKNLVSAYGRSMVSVSLQTTDKSEAKLRARLKRTELDRELEALGKERLRPLDGYSGTLLTLTDADIEHICERYRADRLGEDERQRVAGIDDHGHQLDLDILEDGVSALRRDFAKGELGDVYKGLDSYLREIHVKVPRRTAPYERLAHRFQEAEMEVYDAILKRRNGHAADIPRVTLDGLSFDDVFEAWRKRKASRPPKTVRAFEQAFEALATHCTAMTPRMLRKPDAAVLRDKMIASGDMSRRTVQKLMSFLQSAFQCVVDDGLLPSNPFHGVKVTLDEQDAREKARLPFTVDQLQTIFQGPIYQPGFTPRESLGNACYWLPLLAVFSAARLEELAQLHAEDVCKDPGLGWYLDIHAGGMRKVKTASSIRTVPLHPQLVTLGFLQLVKDTKQGRLFPSLRPDTYGKLATSFSTWFGLYLDELDIKSRKLVFHSFRHSFLQVCKEESTVIPAEVREAIAGHLSKKKISDLYGSDKYPLRPMVNAMKHVKYKGLDLTHLRPSSEQQARRSEAPKPKSGASQQPVQP